MWNLRNSTNEHQEGKEKEEKARVGGKPLRVLNTENKPRLQ